MLTAEINKAFDNRHRDRVLRTFDLSTLQIATNNNYVLTREGVGPNFTYGFRQASGVGPILAKVDANRLAGDATTLNGLAVMTHGDVKGRADWRALYHYKSRPLLFCKNSDTGMPAPHGSLPSYPCGYCGLVLPEQLIQVDHRQPQKWPAVAIMKVLRTIGQGLYAQDGPSGQKGRQLGALAGAAAIKPLKVGKHEFGRSLGQNMPGGGNAVEKRYSITSEGELFITVCTLVWGESNLTNACLNNVLNLVPACAMCNGGAGKGGYPFMHPA